MTVETIAWLAVLFPLVGSLIAGIGGKSIGNRAAHTATIFFMLLSFLCSVWLFYAVTLHGASYNGNLYTWGVSGSFQFAIGLWIDSLTAMMMLVVTFVSLLVHIYSVGYMAHDPGYPRFFSYMSLFTFAMLMLVTANNFLQLFFGWEGVGLVSYLLIGFWFRKERAAAGSLKAFLVNRVGDFGFLLGMSGILVYFGSLDYQTVFSGAHHLTQTTISIIPGHPWSIITVICILLFIGAMGKSAQMPLHIWLPESMEGPTPISALIHAATMVTAGVFMIARLSPLFELSTIALGVVLVIGATTALFTGLLAFVECDIKRVIAFSTMSQLGYMIAADGASAYNAGIFHLLTHAFFKALLFLAAGSVIIALHHEQDMRKMGNLRKYLPMTYILFLIGALSLAAVPPFAGFYSKDAIIDAVRQTTTPGATYAYICLLIGTFVTGYYIFRAFFMTFHTQERMSASVRAKIKETPWVLRGPLWALAIPAIVAGAVLVYPMEHLHAAEMALHAFSSWPFWFSILGIFTAWATVVWKPKILLVLSDRFSLLRRILINQYGFDAFNNRIFVIGSQKLSDFFYTIGDLKLLDHFMVDGTGRGVTHLSQWLRRLQSGYLYHYVLAMIMGVLGFLIWLVLA